MQQVLTNHNPAVKQEKKTVKTVKKKIPSMVTIYKTFLTQCNNTLGYFITLVLLSNEHKFVKISERHVVPVTCKRLYIYN